MVGQVAANPKHSPPHAAADSAESPLTRSQQTLFLIGSIVTVCIVSTVVIFFEFACGMAGLCSTILIVFGINLVGWIISAARQTEKIYDLIGATSYAIAAINTITQSHAWLDWSSSLWLRQSLLTLLVLIWSIRLGSFLVARVMRSGEDRRFKRAKANPLEFLQFWMGQVMWITLAGLPVYLVNLQPHQTTRTTTTNSIGIGFIGIALFYIGLYIEARADAEKAAFKKKQHLSSSAVGGRVDPNLHGWIDTGLWSIARHPNYAGEILLWTGISLLAFDSLPPSFAHSLACIASPVFLTLLLTFVSGVPILERHARQTWGSDPAWKSYVQRTGIFGPRKLEDSVRIVLRYASSCLALLAAWLGARMFGYVAHSLHFVPSEINAWPWYSLSQPIEFDLIDSRQNPYLILFVHTVWNMLLILQFGVLHVGLARPIVYRTCGSRYQRVIFMWVTCVSYHLVMLLWRHNPGYELWNFVPSICRLTSAVTGFDLTPAVFLQTIWSFISFILILLCFSTVVKHDILYFIGARQCIMSEAEEEREARAYEVELEERKRYWKEKTKSTNKNEAKEHEEKKWPLEDQKESMKTRAEATSSSSSSDASSTPVDLVHKSLQVDGMYRYVRHPMYFWLQLLCFFTPVMSYDRFCYGVLTTILLVIGLKFEEEKLIREFGEEYRRYQKRTPMMCPRMGGRRTRKEEQEKEE